MKGIKKSEKRTYLVKSALKLIESDSALVFQDNRHKTEYPGSLRGKHHKEGADKWTPHDIRRTVATRLKQMGFSNEHVSALFGHSFGKLNRTYMVYDYQEEKKAMLLAWKKN